MLKAAAAMTVAIPVILMPKLTAYLLKPLLLLKRPGVAFYLLTSKERSVSVRECCGVKLREVVTDIP